MLATLELKLSNAQRPQSRWSVQRLPSPTRVSIGLGAAMPLRRFLMRKRLRLGTARCRPHCGLGTFGTSSSRLIFHFSLVSQGAAVGGADSKYCSIKSTAGGALRAVNSATAATLSSM